MSLPVTSRSNASSAFEPFENRRFRRHIAHVRHSRSLKLAPSEYVELYGQRWHGNAVRVGTSSLHGHGLFATRGIPAWSIVTMFPVDFLEHSKTSSDGAVYQFLSTEFSFAGAGPHAVLNCREALQDYALILNGIPNSGVVSFNNMITRIYGDPTIHRPGELGHFINDKSSLTTSSSMGEYANYLRAAIEVNTMPYMLGMYQVAIITTRDIVADEELVMSYGENVWTPTTLYEDLPPAVQQLCEARDVFKATQQQSCLTAFSNNDQSTNTF